MSAGNVDANGVPRRCTCGDEHLAHLLIPVRRTQLLRGARLWRRSPSTQAEVRSSTYLRSRHEDSSHRASFASQKFHETRWTSPSAESSPSSSRKAAPSARSPNVSSPTSPVKLVLAPLPSREDQSGSVERPHSGVHGATTADGRALAAAWTPEPIDGGGKGI